MNERQQARARQNAEFFEGVERQPTRSTDMKSKTFLYNAANPSGKLHDVTADDRAELIASGEWFDSPADVPADAMHAAELDKIKSLPAPTVLFVRADGSDRNDGKANTRKGAFRTVEKAFEAVSRLRPSYLAIAVGESVKHMSAEPPPAPVAPAPDLGDEDKDSALLAKFKAGKKMTKAELVALGKELGQDDMDDSATVAELTAEMQAVIG